MSTRRSRQPPPPEPICWAADGQPANLLAAADDALDWLMVFRDVFAHDPPRPWIRSSLNENRARLDRAIAALQRHLAPHRELAEVVVELGKSEGDTS
jgi:hypothetical protein